jgi:ankyrin repeat protein
LTRFLPYVERNETVTIEDNKKINHEISAEILKKALIEANTITKDFSVSSTNTPSQINSTPEKSSEFFTLWKTHDPNQALRRAAALKDENDLEQLLKEKDININSQDNTPEKGYTALHLAIINGKEKNALYLLWQKASYSIPDKKGKTAIDYMVEKKQTLLLNYLKDIICIEYESDDLAFILRKAAFKGEAETLKILLAHGVNVDQVGPESGQTALHRAVQNNHEKCVKLLLESGARIDIEDKKQKKPIHYVNNDTVLQLLQLNKVSSPSPSFT